jgi:hypothetical protein
MLVMETARERRSERREHGELPERCEETLS